jgi:protein-tyrosine-phosphatase
VLCIAFLPAIGLSGFAQAEKASENKPANPLVTALWYAHLNAAPDVLGPGHDKALKAALTLALRDKTGFSTTVGDQADRQILKAILGNQAVITREKMETAVRTGMPASRAQLNTQVLRHADLLTTQFDLIETRHHDGAGELAGWIAKNYQAGKSLGVVIVCTGNSRRSILGSIMGNIAAAYYGLPDLRFYSGGTKPSAFNSRTVAALRGIGVEIEATGQEAPRGESGEANPIYRVRWGNNLETMEFSKLYSNISNPQSNFAAVLVCSEADESCPTVRGAGKRIAVPYQDPKVYDGAEFEAAKYIERRDDMGRFMMSVAMQARRLIDVQSKSK